MKIRNIIFSVLLSLSILTFGIGATAPCAFADAGTGVIKPYSIDNVTAHLEKKSSDKLYYRVTAKSLSGMSDSMTAKIVLQKKVNGNWTDKETITKTKNNVTRFDVSGTINVKSYGNGDYRIKVTMSDVYKGIKSTSGTVYSVTAVN